ncbi:hypothetical protein IFR05_006768 [Cadophora sp. M221]|nr:hypothetical protein IFR05_006768 [Cadophora sp. M221]
MFHITQTLRQKLPSNLKAASNFSSTAVKVPASAQIHSIKIVELHDILHAKKEPKLQLHGLQFHNAAPSPPPATLTAQTASSDKSSAMAKSQHKEFQSMVPPSPGSIAGAARQTISALISQSAEAQINEIRESRGKYQDKYNQVT